ncbi:MAG: FAD synthetase family protein [Lachnospiraceae bacterium]|nr:FAD synthetase family protein [Candidatus Colinaster scatohippi]
MNIIKGTMDFRIESPTAICIGKFDGVHMGHKKLIECITAQKDKAMLATVFTMKPSPEELFSGVKSEPLCTDEEKESYLEALGVDVIVELPLTFETAAMEPERFVKDILIDRLNMKYIAAGPDLSFGDKGAGNWELMKSMSARYGFDYEIIEKIKADGEEISSSRIRSAMANGHVDKAYKMLGRTKR